MRLAWPSALSFSGQRGRLGEIDQLAQFALDVVADFGRIDEQGRAPRGRHDGEGERDRRVLEIAAPDIEQPGDRIEQGQKHGVDIALLEVRLHVADLVEGAAPGIFDAVRHDLGGRRLGPVLPQRIDRVGLDRIELDARLGERLGQPLDLFDGMQRGIVADRRALGEIVGDPSRRFSLRRLQHLEQSRVGLRPGLEDVAPVDEQCRRTCPARRPRRPIR